MVVVIFARLILAIVFAVAGFAKFANPKGTRELAKDFGAPESLAHVFALLLPLAELACAAMLIPAATAQAGAIATLALLVIFIIGISVSLARGKRPDCNCFGQIQSAPIGPSTIVRNVALAALAVLVIGQGSAAAQPRLGDVLGANSGGSSLTGVLFALFALTAAAALFMTYVLLRQNGRLALRIDALEAQLGPAPVQEQGLPVDTEAPAFVLPSLDGGRVSFEELRRSHPDMLLFFMEPGCGPCEAMLPDVGRWQRDHADRLHIVIISRGTAEANRAKVEKAGVTGVLLQEDREVGQAFLVTATPSAILITGGRIASPIAAGSDAIRALIGDATRPKPYAKGEQVMPLALPDLDGRPVELSQLGPRKTVLLFWSPNCGFCTDALDDVKWWEQHRDPALADLVVITSGDVASNRAQGFQSRVVLDRDFEAGNRFGSGGTPSAVIVDERGRVASDVAVGAPEVLALAGSASPARRAS